MARIVKAALAAIGVFIVSFGCVIGYVAATFDSSQYERRAVEVVKQSTRRTLKFDGEIHLSLFPQPAMSVSGASLSEPDSEKIFLRVDDVRAAVGLIPLLFKRVSITSIELRGVDAHLVRSKDGKLNFEDILGAGATKPARRHSGLGRDGEGSPAKPAETRLPAASIEIVGVEVDGASIDYFDEAGGGRVALSNVRLQTDRIADGVVARVQMAFGVRGDRPPVNLEIAAKTGLLFESEKRRIRLDDLQVSIRGDGPGVTGLDAFARGGIEVQGAQSEILASGLTLAASGKRPGGGFNLKLDIPEITGSTEARRLALPRILLTATAVDSTLSASPVDARIEGTAHLDLAHEDGSVQFVARLDDSRIEGRAGVTRFAQPAYTFDCSIDQLDLDRYRSRTDARTTGGAGRVGRPVGPDGPSTEKPIDLSPLESLTLNGTIRIGRFKAANLSSSQVRADIQVDEGRLDVAPLTADLYGGSLAGAFSAQSGPDPLFRLTQQLSEVNVGDLLKDAANSDRLEGKGNLSLEVTTRGATTVVLRRNLNGSAAMSLLDGSIQGIDLARTLRDAKAKLRDLRGKRTGGESRSDKTPFTELTATFAIENGVVRNDDLSIKSPLLRVGGEGEIDLVNDRVDYTLKPTVVGTTRGQGGREVSDLGGLTIPVRIIGSLKDPRVAIDTGSLMEEAVKGLLGGPKEGSKGEKGGRKPKDLLKGLLGR